MAKKHAPANHQLPPASPVRTVFQPVTRARCCGQPVTYPREPGAANAALTTHWNRVHGGDLSLLAVLTGTA
jgi:hypothetical protein